MIATQAAVTGVQPCVWMCAGMLSYRLCARDFDCEHCPLDAALREEMPWHAGAILHHPGNDDAIRSDRLYSTGHTWLQPLQNAPHVWRVGLDAFAAAIIGSAAHVSCEESHRQHAQGYPMCWIDLGLGVLSIGAPLPGRVVRSNQMLESNPDRVVTEPYDDGWILEYEATAEPDPEQIASPDAARDQIALDLRRFRRSVAFRLLAEANGHASNVERACEQLTDLRCVVAGGHYVDLLRDFIH